MRVASVLERTRGGVITLLIAVSLLLSALPAAGGQGSRGSDLTWGFLGSRGSDLRWDYLDPRNITWERVKPRSITWESITWE